MTQQNSKKKAPLTGGALNDAPDFDGQAGQAQYTKNPVDGQADGYVDNLNKYVEEKKYKEPAVTDWEPAVPQPRWDEFGKRNVHVTHSPDNNKPDFEPSTPAPEVPDYVPPVRLGEDLPLTDLKFIEKCFHEENMGDGRLMAIVYEGRLLFDHSASIWYLWAGHRWKPDQTNQITLLYSAQGAAQYHRAAGELRAQAEKQSAQAEKLQNQDLYDLAKDAPGETIEKLLQEANRKVQTAQAMVKRTKELRKRSRKNDALHYAASLLPITGNEWDQAPRLLPVENGIVDLTTGKYRPGRPKDKVRTAAPVEWRGLDAPAPRWESALLEIMGGSQDPPGMVAFLQRLFGYALLGTCEQHILTIFWGPKGRNGKDTIFETLNNVLGDIASPVHRDVILVPEGRRNPNSAEPHLMALQGKRLAWANEPKEGARLDAAQVKALTGGNSITGRELYQRTVTFTPTHTLFLATNFKPHAPADDLALWERVHLVGFTQRFVSNPVPGDPNEHLADPHLREDLLREGPGILAWLVQGALEYQRLGLGAPGEVKLLTTQYRQGEDTLGQFIDECLVVGPDFSTSAGLIYKEYKTWSVENSLSPMNGNTFGTKMAERFEVHRTGQGRFYREVGLRQRPSM